MDKETKSVQEWDKTFPKSEKVKHEKVTFKTQYGLTLAADLYIPKNAEGKLPAIAVSGPFGAVKEQCSGLYAQTMAEHGFITIAFDPSFTGESSGEPRRTASPDINTEDFLAAVDYLSMRDDVDAERIAIIGICGWGGIALNAAAQDPRIKATAAITMYDMSRVSGNGYFDADDSEESRYAARKAWAEARTADLKNRTFTMAGGVVDPLPENAPQFVKDYHAYYKHHVAIISVRATQTTVGVPRAARLTPTPVSSITSTKSVPLSSLCMERKRIPVTSERVPSDI